MQSFIEYLLQLPGLTQVLLLGCAVVLGILVAQLIKATQIGKRYRTAVLGEESHHIVTHHHSIKAPGWLKFLPGLVFGKEEYSWTELILMYAFLALAFLALWTLWSLVS